MRIVPIHECQGIGIASPKGTDPSGFRSVVQGKLNERFQPGQGPASTGVLTDDRPGSGIVFSWLRG